MWSSRDAAPGWRFSSGTGRPRPKTSSTPSSPHSPRPATRSSIPGPVPAGPRAEPWRTTCAPWRRTRARSGSSRRSRSCQRPIPPSSTPRSPSSPARDASTFPFANTSRSCTRRAAPPAGGRWWSTTSSGRVTVTPPVERSIAAPAAMRPSAGQRSASLPSTRSTSPSSASSAARPAIRPRSTWRPPRISLQRRSGSPTPIRTSRRRRTMSRSARSAGLPSRRHSWSIPPVDSPRDRASRRPCAPSRCRWRPPGASVRAPSTSTCARGSRSSMGGTTSSRSCSISTPRGTCMRSMPSAARSTPRSATRERLLPCAWRSPHACCPPAA